MKEVNDSVAKNKLLETRGTWNWTEERIKCYQQEVICMCWLQALDWKERWFESDRRCKLCALWRREWQRPYWSQPGATNESWLEVTETFTLPIQCCRQREENLCSVDSQKDRERCGDVISPDYVHGLVDDFWLVDRYDLLGPRSGSEHGEDARPAAHIEHHLQDGRTGRGTAWGSQISSGLSSGNSCTVSGSKKSHVCFVFSVCLIVLQNKREKPTIFILHRELLPVICFVFFLFLEEATTLHPQKSEYAL